MKQACYDVKHKVHDQCSTDKIKKRPQ